MESGLRPGATFGPYVIADRLGAGGMGLVYRARDTKLGRDVAVKVLPDSTAFDADRRSRLQREARLLASLSHPHIAAIYGIEDANGHIALILELVEGPTLAERLVSGPIPVDEAVGITRQIAAALDAAHERGIIHRDLKPANVKLAPGRGVKVLDFGLAKTLAGPAAADDFQPTITSDGTLAGTILGTAAYMSPEQARGLLVDKRTDIWALGCVIYEMLTGRRAFPGATMSDTIAAILERQPDWQALPPATPAHLRQTLGRCLEKDPQRRLRDLGDIELGAPPASSEDRAAAPAPPANRAMYSIAGALALAAATAGVTAFLMSRQTATPPASSTGVVRFSIPPPPGNRFGSTVPDVEATYLALSSDGSQLAFVATDDKSVSRVWLRGLSSLEARALAGTEGAISVFWSPDGRSLGFFVRDQLKRMDLPDGRPVTLAAVPAGVGIAGTWTETGQILFGSIQGTEITSVPTAGGNPSSAAAADAPRERRLQWPSAMPNDRLMYLALRDDATGDLKLVEPGGAARSLMTLNSNAAWVDPGFVVFAREGSLLAQAIDLQAGRLVGQPHAIADTVDYTYLPPRAAFSASRSGTVAFQPHRDRTRLVRFDRTGAELGAIGGQPAYTQMRIAPDGRRILVTATDARFGTNELWIFDPARGGVETRQTSDPRPEVPGPWAPRHNRFVYSVARGGAPHLFERDLATGADREVLPATGFQLAGDFTPDGQHIVFAERPGSGNWSLMMTTIGAKPVTTPLLNSPFSVLEPRLSRDGRAIAFISNESERFEVYVSPFPMAGQKIRASSGGGRAPRWSPDGRELFYLSLDGRLMAVPIRTSPTLHVGTPRTVLTMSKRWIDFDVSSADGTIIAIVPQVVAREQPVTVILNWKEEIRK